MYLKQELIRENSSEEKHILPQKQFEKWELKSKTQREELLPHHFLLKKWRQAELWKGERLAGAGGSCPSSMPDRTLPGLCAASWPCLHSPHFPIALLSHPAPPGKPWERGQELWGKSQHDSMDGKMRRHLTGQHFPAHKTMLPLFHPTTLLY